jgi:hypothetical protein
MSFSRNLAHTKAERSEPRGVWGDWPPGKKGYHTCYIYRPIRLYMSHSDQALPVTARRAKRENGGLGEDPPGSPIWCLDRSKGPVGGSSDFLGDPPPEPRFSLRSARCRGLSKNHQINQLYTVIGGLPTTARRAKRENGGLADPPESLRIRPSVCPCYEGRAKRVGVGKKAPTNTTSVIINSVMLRPFV